MVKDVGFMVMLKLLASVFGGVSESATLTVKLNVPSAVGVPKMAPVFELRLKPGGRLPDIIDQL